MGLFKNLINRIKNVFTPTAPSAPITPAPKRQTRKEKRQARKEKRQVQTEKRTKQKAEEIKAKTYSERLKSRDETWYKIEQKSANSFFGHTPNAKELNTWRELVNTGVIDKIKELAFAQYDTEEVKDSVQNLLKSDLTSDEVVDALNDYIKSYASREKTLYDYVQQNYGEIIYR